LSVQTFIENMLTSWCADSWGNFRNGLWQDEGDRWSLSWTQSHSRRHHCSCL
jgi:hypothetical protein